MAIAPDPILELRRLATEARDRSQEAKGTADLALLRSERAETAAKAAANGESIINQNVGRLLGELARARAEVRLGFRTLGVKLVWREGRSGRQRVEVERVAPGPQRSPSGHSLEGLYEDITGSHMVPTLHPVRAWVERKTGQAVFWVLGGLASAGAGIGLERLAIALWRAFHGQ